MPRRSQTRASNLQLAPATSSPPPFQDPDSENLLLLRRQWKWAAFGQFYHTFSQLFNLNDVAISDIEKDLVWKTNSVIPRVMHKLLFSLSNDRKVSPENWQTVLRKQYNKRDPQANPIGPEPNDQKKDTKEEDEEPLPLDSEPVDKPLEQGHGKELAGEISTTTRESSNVLEPETNDAPSPHGSRHSSIAQIPQTKAENVKDDGIETEGEEESKDWFDLPMLTKLESIHTLTEWQFQNTTRLRTLMKSDDEFASWRIEPIGYDSKRNAYWFIGGDRLWIQRLPPKPPRSQSSKRKRPTNKSTDKKSHASKTKLPPPKRARLDDVNISSASLDNAPSSSGRHSRAAKDQAKIKLDLQAKELAKLNREATKFGHKTKSSHSSPPKQQSSRISSRVVGTRTSARLRGSQEDEWQPIPTDWLNSPIKPKKQTSKLVKTGLESDEETISDLTELSDEGEEATTSTPNKNGIVKTNGNSTPKMDSQLPDEVDSQETPADFVEWETICVTLQEWEHIHERFEKATHYAEKALHKTLINDIVPVVMHELREIERKREIEEALVHRKRSSRLAIRENEREEARLAALKKQEEDEKFGRARRMEARLQKEEAERVKRENAREQRRKEREAREESRKSLTAQERLENAQAAKSATDRRSRSAKGTGEDVANGTNGNGTNGNGANGNGTNGSHSGSRTPVGEDWELACEICHRRGINLDDGTPMMSCGLCSKWQHIRCHDRADQAAGRPRRNWDAVDFICARCRSSYQDNQRDRVYLSPQHHQIPNSSQMQQSYRPYPQVLNPPSDTRNPYYGNRDQPQQSFYIRPQNPQPRNPSQYSDVPMPPVARPTISFSHYQPTAHGFSTGAQQPYNEPPSYYGPPNPQYRPAPQPPYKSQTHPAWNITTPAHTPGYNLPHNGVATTSNPNIYRNPSYEQQERVHMNDPSQMHPRYPDQQYPPPQYKHLPSSYQPPLGR